MLPILLVRSSLHHVTKLHDGLGAAFPEVSEEVPLVEAVLEEVDDIIVRDLCDGGACLKEAAGVGPQGLVLLLFALGQVRASNYPYHGALEVADEGLLQVISRVDGVWLEALDPCEWC